MNLKCYDYGRITLGFALITLIIFSCDTSIALAASDIDTNIVAGDPGGFNTMMGNWLDSMIFAAKAISTIMIVLGGLNIALNLGNNTLSTVWSAAFGIGLILNIGLFFTEATWVPVDTSPPSAPHFDLKVQSAQNFDESFKAIIGFPEVYRTATVAGANYLIGPATKLLLVLTAINMIITVSLKLIEGDKITYLTKSVLETGAYFFLITNWYGDKYGINIMGSLCAGFEQLGYHAGGFTDAAPNDILGNSWKIFSAIQATGTEGFNLFNTLITVIFAIVILILLVLTGIEMFMARIEFWTLAMATIPLVPFAALPQTRFLFQSALSGMMNLAIKVSVIAFISAISTGILTDYVQAFTKPPSGTSIAGNISLFIQALLVSLLLYLLVKKIPQLVSSLLSGRPELSGASMTQMAKSVASKGVQAASAVATGGASVATSGFKAAGVAAAGGKGGWGQLGAGFNAAGGAMLTGGKDMMARALIGSKNSNDAAGGGGGMRSGGLLSGAYNAVQRGKQMGQQFNSAKNDGTFKTATGMTGVDKAIDIAKDPVRAAGDAANKIVNAVANNPYSSAKAAAKNPKPSAGSQTTTNTSTSSTTTSTPSRSNLANKVNQGYKPTGNNNSPKK